MLRRQSAFVPRGQEVLEPAQDTLHVGIARRDTCTILSMDEDYIEVCPSELLIGNVTLSRCMSFLSSGKFILVFGDLIHKSFCACRQDTIRIYLARMSPL